MKEPVRLIPFVCGAGASVPGAEQGAPDLKKAGLLDYLQGLGVDAAWQEDPEHLYEGSWGKKAHTNLPDHGSNERKEIVMWHCRHLAGEVEAVLEQNMMPVTLGGDHAMAAGSIAGLARAKNAHGKIGVIWIDAHADLNTPETSNSQAMHGMPVAALLGMGDEDFAGIGGGTQPVLKPEHIVYLGIRDVEPAEEEYMRELGIRGYNVEEVREQSLEKIMQDAVTKLSQETDCLVLSIDLDGFDPSEAPSTGTPVSGGFTGGEMFPVLRKITEAGNFDLIEIAEYNPALEGREKTLSLIRGLLDATLV